MSSLSRRPAVLLAAGCLIVALSAVGVLPLPDPLAGGGSVGLAAAATDPAAVAGIPDPCPTVPELWHPSPSGSECVLEMDACLESAMYPGSHPRRYLRPEDPFYGLCEEEVDKSVDPDLFTNCEMETIPYGRDYTVEVEGDLCTLRVPAQCPAGLGRIAPATCRGVVRRHWTCPAGHEPLNRHGQCYQPPGSPPAPGTHPACGPGGPNLSTADCERYAGGDYIESPDPTACAGYELHTPAARMDDTANHFWARPGLRDAGTHRSMGANPANHFWCRFNARWLSLDCHRGPAAARPPDCAGLGSEPAFCLMRTTATGGCSAVARTVRCRALQAGLADDAEEVALLRPPRDPRTNLRLRATRAEIRRQGCVPCASDPFDGQPPQPYCVEATVSEARGTTGPRPTPRDTCTSHAVAPACKRAILTSGDYDPPGLAGAQRCGTPPPGVLSWSPSHFSGQAVVNTGVRLQIDSVNLLKASTDFRHGRTVVFRLKEDVRARIMRGDLSGGVPYYGGHWYNVPAYAEILAGDPYEPGRFDRDSASLLGFWPTETGDGFCAIDELPSIQVEVRELWPDDPVDRATIQALFAPGSLDWWTALDGAAQRRVVGARGLAWAPSLLPADQQARRDRLTEPLECGYSQPVWCDWTPVRSGFYVVTAKAAWVLRPYSAVNWAPGMSGGCGRVPYACLATRVPILGDSNRTVLLYGGLEGLRCYLFSQSPRQRTELRNLLAGLGVTPAEVGFNAGLTDLIPWFTNDPGTPCTYGTMGGRGYTLSPLDPDTRCPSIDVRVGCDISRDYQGRFAESDPIGIAVHEVPVRTRTPSTG